MKSYLKEKIVTKTYMQNYYSEQTNNKIEILLIEDKSVDSGQCLKMLTDNPLFNVYSIQDFKQAQEMLLKEKKIDLILLVLCLPNEDGISLFEKIQQETSDIPIIILTDNDDKEIEVSFARKGAQDYLIKGQFDNQLLFHSIVYSIERFKLLSEKELLSITDELTNLNNRRGFSFLSKKYLEVAKRNKSLICLFYIDINKFKQINDFWGHIIGDSILQDLALIIRETFRESDIIARMGGDEFVILLYPSVNSKDLNSIEKRLQENLEKYNITHTIKIHLSIGISSVKATNHITLEKLLYLADRNMYEKKFT